MRCERRHRAIQNRLRAETLGKRVLVAAVRVADAKEARAPYNDSGLCPAGSRPARR
jgi:hypothetical protein